MIRMKLGLSAMVLALAAACSGQSAGQDGVDMVTRWDGLSTEAAWEGAMQQALGTHAVSLTQVVPTDIADWCPAYADAGPEGRVAFWAAFFSALTKIESTHNERAVNPNGKWFGLMQIAPATARGYGCQARTGEALRNGAANLSCAARILAVTVPRDGVIATKDSRWRGVAADWGPLRVGSKRAEISQFTRSVPACRGA